LKNNYNDLPQLIVALDNKDDTANYVHINDVRDDLIYYCPCCKGVVKPRAYKKENDYQVQPHFYHESGGCSEESFVHYICKTWLFENGSVFIVDGDTFTVSDIETEKTLHTSFGDYRPDVIVETKEGKAFFFEIAYSSKKSVHYIPVWDELDNDVIEINAREFINQKHNNDIPEFKVIYSDGECYIKSYTKNDYDDTIGKRKLEWKRQDKLNYKIQWEKLDWFWNEMQQYKLGNKTINDVFEYFKCLDISDKEVCFDLLKRQQCIKKENQNFRDIINNECKCFWRTKAEKLIGNNMSFNIWYRHINPRKNITVFGEYKNVFGDKTIYKVQSFENREWIIRYSLLNKIIDSVRTKIDINNKVELIKSEYENVINDVMNEITSKFRINGCIWYIEKQDKYNFKLGIKNEYSAYHHSYIYLVSSEDDNWWLKHYSDGELNYANIYKTCRSKIEREMRRIHDYVSNKDGIGADYRHMFTNSSEVSNDK